MDSAAAVQLALSILNSALSLIAEIKAQHGMSDDQILAHAKEVTAANDEAYARLVAALKSSQ